MNHTLEPTKSGLWSSRQTRLPWLIAAIVAAVQLLATVGLPKAVSWDPSYGILAAKHYVDGKSPDLIHIRMADATDLSEDVLFDPGYWAPGYQMVPWLIRGGRLSWGVALRLTIALALVAGVAGWGLFFRRATGDLATTGWLLLAMICARYCWVFTLVYQGGDLLLWAAAPWLLLLNLKAVRKESAPSCVLWTIAAGLAASGVFLLKYSGAFLAAGLGVVWVWSWWRKRVPMARVFLWGCSVIFAFATIRALGFPSHQNPATTRFGWLIVEAIGSLGLAASGPTDFESLAAKVLEVVKLSGTEWHVGTVGFALLILILVAIALARKEETAKQILGDETPDRLARTAGVVLGVVDISALALLYSIGGNLGPQARLGRVAGLFLLPAAFLALRAGLRSANLTTRWLSRVVVALVLVIPAMYGIAAGGQKISQGWRYRISSIGADGVACYYLKPATNHDAFFREVETALPDPKSLLVVVHPQLAFPLTARRVLVFDGLEALTLSQLERTRFSGHPPGGVALLVHRSQEEDTRSAIVRRAFANVASWRMLPLATDPEWVLWIGQD